jgi:hypothetical protein
MYIRDILAAIVPLSSTQRQALFEQLVANWCIHCGRDRERGAAGCECGRAFEGGSPLGAA